jgi:hypothetical protein
MNSKMSRNSGSDPISIFSCNAMNIEGPHSRMEMLLSSLFDGSFSNEAKTLIASNNSLEYTYTKEGIGSRMSLKVVSLEAPLPHFIVKFGNKPFIVCPIQHPLLDLRRVLCASTHQEIPEGAR